jgi:hypothetical protein
MHPTNPSLMPSGVFWLGWLGDHNFFLLLAGLHNLYANKGKEYLQKYCRLMIRALQNVLTLTAMTLPEPLQVITKQTHLVMSNDIVMHSPTDI